MSTVAEFEAAPVGATATLIWKRAVKTFYDGTDRNWLSRDGEWLSAQELVEGNWTLDPTPTVPTSAREALWLAWNLAHPVKEGQVLPANTETISISDVSLHMTSEGWDQVVEPGLVGILRTLEPLPDPEPDWLDAPAVLAFVKGHVGDPRVFERENKTGTQWLRDTKVYRWDELTVVTPLYPKEDA